MRLRALLETSSWKECWCVAVPGLAGFLIAMAIAWSRWPIPSMHDDFGNLLVASTLLEGRFANPVPAAWESMETFHNVLQPTYAAKFPIGLGAMLAIGKLLMGTYAAGLWLCAGIASSCVAWMIRSHFPPRWAMAAGLFTATHPCWQLGWSQEFTNGWLAIAGLSLVLGGLLRIRRSYRSGQMDFDGRLTAIVGLGCALSFFSRPFEGGIVCGLLGLYFVPTLVARKLIWSSGFWRAALPGVAVLAVTCCLQLAINRSVTGQFLQLPYQLHEAQYGVAPVLIWQKPHEPSMGHRYTELVKLHRGWAMDEYRKAASLSGYLTLLQRRVDNSIKHWGYFLALSPLCILAFRAERRRHLGLLFIFVFAFLLINCVPWAMPHYLAPLIPVVIFFSCAVARKFFHWFVATFQPNAKMHRIETIAIFGFLLFQGGGTFVAAHARSKYQPGWEKEVANLRVEMIRHLEQLPEADLVLVQYGPDHDIMFEWVYNEANLDRASVVWARWSSDEMNQAVLKSYRNRKAWKLDFDAEGGPNLSELESTKASAL